MERGGSMKKSVLIFLVIIFLCLAALGIAETTVFHLCPGVDVNLDGGRYTVEGEAGSGTCTLTDGKTELDRFLAMQFDCGDGSEGAAVVYKRENVAANEYRLILNGLNPGDSYSVYSIDSPDDVITLTGDEIMSAGIDIKTEKTPGAYIIFYNSQ